jgi:sulfur-oxidizing protein SoxY
MTFTRREALGLGAGAAVFLATGLRLDPAAAATEDAMKMVMEFAGGQEPAAGKITLTTPEIAENGNTVPISVSVDSAMTADDYVESVMVVATGNPRPGVATFKFSPMSGVAEASTRMRLAKTQKVIAVAKMNSGAVFMDAKDVKVTIGGCGG